MTDLAFDQRSLCRRPGFLTTATSRVFAHPGALSFVLFSLLALASRAAYMGVAIAQDTAGYLYVGRTILNGGAPYVNAAEPKGPVLHLLFAGIVAVSGHSIPVLRLTLVAFMGLAALAVAGYVTRYSGRAAGLLAGCVLAVFGSAGAIFGFDPNSEQYGIAFLAGAWCFAARGTKRDSAYAGALVAAAAFANLGFIAVAPIILFEFLRPGAPKGRRGRLVSAVTGALAVTTVIMIWMVAAGAVNDMKIQMFEYARHYGTLAPPKDPGSLHSLLTVVEPSLWLAGIVGGLVGLTCVRYRKPAVGALLWIVVMWARVKVAALAGTITWGHHYYTAVPGIAVGIAVGTAALWNRGIAVRLAVAAAAVVFCWALIIQPQLNDIRYPASQRGYPLAGADYGLAAFIRNNTPPGAPIFVVGDQAQIYWDANRQASTRWFVDYILKIAPNYATERARDLQRHHPAAIAAEGLDQFAVTPDIQRLITGGLYRLAYGRNNGEVWLLKRAESSIRG